MIFRSPKEWRTSRFMQERAQQEIEIDDFREYLKRDLVERCKRNSSFSLRSYSQLLRISPSLLSRILSGKRSATHSIIDRVAERLAVSPHQLESWKQNATGTRGGG